jgi:predicted PurR-regulated permease PerM
MEPEAMPLAAKRPFAPELSALARQRRRARLAMFIIAESLVVAFTIAAMVAGVSERFLAESFTSMFRIVPIAGAFLAAILPILFFGDPKRRNRPR